MRWRVWIDWTRNSDFQIIDAPDAFTAALRYGEDRKLQVGACVRVAPLKEEVRAFMVGMREVEPS